MMIDGKIVYRWALAIVLGAMTQGNAFCDDEESVEEAEARKEKVIKERLAEEAEVKELFTYSLQDVEDYIVTINCKSERGRSSGSGFIATMDGKTYLFTNQHVVLGADQITFKTVSGLRPRPIGIQVARTGDIIRFTLEQEDGLEFADKVLMKDPIGIFGNSLGGGVATELYGKVTGMGSDLIEVSADFVSGNSGSPVLSQEKNVVGIVSFVRFNYADDDGSKSQRFCYRLKDRQWVPVNWKKFNGKQGALYRSTEENVDELLSAAYRWYNAPNKAVDFSDHPDMGIRRWSKDHNLMVSKIERMLDQGRCTQKELDSINKRIRDELMDSAESLGELCHQRARQVRMLSQQKGLTGYLEKEYESMSDRLEGFNRSVANYRIFLKNFNYFHFE